MTILLGIIATILMIGMVTDRDKDNRSNLTLGFVATLAAIVTLSILK